MLISILLKGYKKIEHIQPKRLEIWAFLKWRFREGAVLFIFGEDMRWLVYAFLGLLYARCMQMHTAEGCMHKPPVAESETTSGAGETTCGINLVKEETFRDSRLGQGIRTYL